MAANFNLGLADEGSYSWKSCPEITPSLPRVRQGRRARMEFVFHPSRGAEQHTGGENRDAGAEIDGPALLVQVPH